MSASSRSDMLSKLGPRGWYTDHLVRSTGCGCTDTKPSRSCDRGEALYRLAQTERGRQHTKKT